jgi:hypothetical protein
MATPFGLIHVAVSGWKRTTRICRVIGFDQHQDLQQIPQPIWHQIVQLLTGLSFEEINNIGGFVVTNSQTEQEVFNSLMVYV